MKHVVSVSIGSSKRDHAVELEILGEQVHIERRGTDGDIARAIALIRELDGQVAAFGLGGLDLYIWAGRRRYVLRDGRRIARAAVQSPIVDGSGLKNSLEPRVIAWAARELGLDWSSQKVLLVAAADRFGMARALAETGCELVLGDLMFVLGMPIPLRSVRSLELVARVVAPIVVQLPFTMLYPTGANQEAITPRYTRYYRWADVLAGDFHLIRRYMPDDLAGKTVITNTVTPADIEELRRRGVRLLVTTTPNLGGRSFGTNTIEAVLVALLGRIPGVDEPAAYLDLLDRIGFVPRVEVLGEEAGPWNASPLSSTRST